MGLVERLILDISNWLDRHITNLSYSMSVLVTTCGAMTLQEWMYVTGIAVAIGTFFVNWHYRRKTARILKDLGISQRIYEETNR
ncbi:HP1 family phage holin [Limnobaculum xujianqingii]|uniref:HP1 family phage holin n=1 Tax=Limnobaculum xujianqingii TaxID=2738837 RepID=UPI0015BF0E2E|nr:HP1 family phage holin [Limnobaculum xujianqingii]